jgi:hypothetical protein
VALGSVSIKQADVIEVFVSSAAQPSGFPPPMDSLYLCTGLLTIDFNSDHVGFSEGTADVPIQRSAVPGHPLDIGTRQLKAKSATAGLSDIDNLNTDNGQWKIDNAKIRLSSDDPGHPHLLVTAGVNGNAEGDIRLHSVEYVAFLLVAAAPLARRSRLPPPWLIFASAAAGVAGGLATAVTIAALRRFICPTFGGK